MIFRGWSDTDRGSLLFLHFTNRMVSVSADPWPKGRIQGIKGVYEGVLSDPVRRTCRWGCKFVAEEFHITQQSRVQEVHLCKNIKRVVL